MDSNPDPSSPTSSSKANGLPFDKKHTPQRTFERVKCDVRVPSAESGVEQVINFLKATNVNFLKDTITQNRVLHLLPLISFRRSPIRSS